MQIGYPAPVNTPVEGSLGPSKFLPAELLHDRTIRRAGALYSKNLFVGMIEPAFPLDKMTRPQLAPLPAEVNAYPANGTKATTFALGEATIPFADLLKQ